MLRTEMSVLLKALEGPVEGRWKGSSKLKAGMGKAGGERKALAVACSRSRGHCVFVQSQKLQV